MLRCCAILYRQVFPLCVVEGRLELSTTELIFFPESIIREDGTCEVAIDTAMSTYHRWCSCSVAT
jgi:hypothetical protein